MKNLFCCWLLGLTYLLSSPEGRAVPPANDLCSGAVVIPGAGPFPYLSQVMTNFSEATTNGDPVLSCSTNKSRSVWFKFVPAVSNTYTFSTGGDTSTTLADSVMGLYSASSCSGPFPELSCADDLNGEYRAAFSANLMANVTYFVVVWSFGTNAPGAGADSLQLRVSTPVTPSNDLCSASQVIPSRGPFPYLTAPTDITVASTNSDPPITDCQSIDNFSRSVWYKFIPSNTVTYTFSTCFDTATTVKDTIVAIYTSANGCAGPLSVVDCNDEGCDASRSMVSTTLTKGQTYYVVVWEYGFNSAVPGQAQVQLKVTVPPPVFTSVTNLGSGSYRLAFTGFAGKPYAIDASTNLVDWVAVGSSTNVNGGNYQLTLTNVVSPNYRFFRAREE